VSDDEAAARARQRALVRCGYDVISRAYRTDGGAAHPSSGEDPGRYLQWLQAARLTPLWHQFVPEGNSGHTLILATAS
jgi:hypothetical protein